MCGKRSCPAEGLAQREEAPAPVVFVGVGQLNTTPVRVVDGA